MRGEVVSATALVLCVYSSFALHLALVATGGATAGSRDGADGPDTDFYAAWARPQVATPSPVLARVSVLKGGKVPNVVIMLVWWFQVEYVGVPHTSVNSHNIAQI